MSFVAVILAIVAIGVGVTALARAGDGRVQAAPASSAAWATSRVEADDEGITRKVARIAVRSVAEDGTLVVRVTAWDLPS
jgi:hypothetical protein